MARHKDDFDEMSSKKTGSDKTRARPKGDSTHWEARIEQHLRAQSQLELANLVWSLARRFPEVYQTFRSQLELQPANIDQQLAEVRKEIQKATSGPGWGHHWDNRGYVPNYSKIKHRFETLLELGHADEVVSLGREFFQAGIDQIEESQDEGESVDEFSECLTVVFQAVARSSMSRSEQLLYAIDLELKDDYDAIGEASNLIFEGSSKPEDWSSVANTLTGRLKAITTPESGKSDRFLSGYRRDSISEWIARALENAGRSGDLRSLYESEARTAGNYARLVKYLMEEGQIEEAERWSKEGILATIDSTPQEASRLASSLAEIARRRKQWDVVAAHAALTFFNRPGVNEYNDVITAAKKAKVEESVREAALKFLETGVGPIEVIAQPITTKARQSKSSARRQPASTPEPKPPVLTKVARSWPLPLPDYLLPILSHSSSKSDAEPRPHLEVLLNLALQAKKPDDVLRWYDQIKSTPQSRGFFQGPLSVSHQVAEAVAKTHPDRTIAIYLDALNAQLPRAEQHAYETAAAYLRKLRPVYDSLGRSSDWEALIASIREKYRNRPRFMEILDKVDGQSSVDSTRTKRK